jgi:hypothetical protein
LYDVRRIIMPGQANSRRQFLTALSATAAALVLPSRGLHALQLLEGRGDHPDPRPGIDGSNVLGRDEMDNQDALFIYDMIRSIPQIADGVRCQCGCAGIPGYYSLLTCYETDGMAQHCEICQAQGMLVYELHEKGQSLQQIRDAVDVEFG